MRNQFFYSRKVALPLKEGETEPKYEYPVDSFNINKVIRSMEIEGKILILLDDFHERTERVPVFNKQGKATGMKNEKNTFQSEIYLTEPSDIQAFRDLLSVVE